MKIFYTYMDKSITHENYEINYLSTLASYIISPIRSLPLAQVAMPRKNSLNQQPNRKLFSLTLIYIGLKNNSSSMLRNTRRCWCNVQEVPLLRFMAFLMTKKNTSQLRMIQTQNVPFNFKYHLAKTNTQLLKSPNPQEFSPN